MTSSCILASCVTELNQPEPALTATEIARIGAGPFRKPYKSLAIECNEIDRLPSPEAEDFRFNPYALNRKRPRNPYGANRRPERPQAYSQGGDKQR